MTQDDIIRMAREADVWVVGQEPYQTQLERFAALVAASEREKCAAIVRQHGGTAGPAISMLDAIRARGQA